MELKKAFSFCIGDSQDGSVVKEFPNRKARESYIEYLKVSTANEDWDQVADYCRATCKPGDKWVLNFQKPIFS